MTNRDTKECPLYSIDFFSKIFNPSYLELVPVVKEERAMLQHKGRLLSAGLTDEEADLLIANQRKNLEEMRALYDSDPKEYARKYLAADTIELLRKLHSDRSNKQELFDELIKRLIQEFPDLKKFSTTPFEEQVQ